MLHCVKFQLKWINIQEMRAKPVRQRIEKKACFREQLLKNSSQTALYLSHDLGRAECVRCPWLLAQTKVATIATLGLSCNLSLAEDLESLSLQDGPQSGIILSLDPKAYEIKTKGTQGVK